MFDLIQKTMLTGVGLVAMTREKVEELAKELTEKGKLSEKEGKELIDDLLKKYEQAKKDLDNKMEERVKKVLKKMDVATQKDIRKLEKKITHLEQKEAAENKAGMNE